MNKFILSLLVVPLVLGASVASAEMGGTITKSFEPATPPASIETVYDVANPDLMLISGNQSAYRTAVNKIVTTVLQMFKWDANAYGTLTFTDTNYSITNDCNTLFGTYKVNGGTIELSTPGMTMMACDQAAMVADQRLATSLDNVSQMSFQDGKLVLDGNKITMKFTPDLSKFGK